MAIRMNVRDQPFLASDLLQFSCFVEGNFGLSRLLFECRIPCPAFGAVKSAAGRMCVRECRIDNMSISDTEKQFMNADSRKEVDFAE